MRSMLTSPSQASLTKQRRRVLPCRMTQNLLRLSLRLLRRSKIECSFALSPCPIPCPLARHCPFFGLSGENHGFLLISVICTIIHINQRLLVINRNTLATLLARFQLASPTPFSTPTHTRLFTSAERRFCPQSCQEQSRRLAL